MKYHVQEYYLATGMEGIPYEKDYGFFEAENEKEAMLMAYRTQADFNEEAWNRMSECDKYFAIYATETT